MITVSGIWLLTVVSLGGYLIYENTKAKVEGRASQYTPIGTLPLEQTFQSSMWVQFGRRV